MNKKRILFVLMGVFAFLIVVTCGSIIYKSKKEKEEFVKNVELIFSSLQSANTIDGAESFNNLGKKIKDIDADVNYHIELDDDGNIKYYLLYNDKYKIEYNGSETLNKKNVIESIKIEKTISVDELKEKQEDLNDKSLENVKYSVTSFNDLENKTSKGYKVKTENNKTVVEIFRGQQKNGCYGLEIKQLTLKNGIVEIVIKETTPSAEVSCIQAITYPAKKVTLDKKYDNITVKTESGNTYSELTTT